MTESEIKAFIRELHNYLRDKMELSETLKPLIVSGILLSLKHTPFERSYKDYADKNDLASAMYQAIEQVLGKAGVKGDKFKAMMSNYAFIKTNKAVKKHLPETISKVSRCLAYALRPNSSLDLLGNFYGEFLRYSGGDKKGLGIVLTPRHVTELFADLADLDPKQSVVLDVCAGTGGFLISAMANMVAKSANDSATIQAIKDKRLIGIETDSHMFTLACANMIFKGDGKSNMFFDDCLNPEKDEKTIEIIGKLKPNVGLLNPPYSKKEEDKAELCFVKRALDLLEPRGTCIAILPISCLIDDSKVTLEAKKDLLASHSLKAVMSMPGQLFPNVGTVTAIAVFEAHKPHCNADGTPKAETWLAYWHDDGYSLLKKDRIERKPGIWAEIKKNWLDDYFKQRVVLGSSYKKGLTGSDEWVAEAFMETDYAKLGKADFEEEVKKFALFKLSSESKPDTGGVE
jgi:type I restriction-modification system DNA methylase subunit